VCDRLLSLLSPHPATSPSATRFLAQLPGKFLVSLRIADFIRLRDNPPSNSTAASLFMSSFCLPRPNGLGGRQRAPLQTLNSQRRGKHPRDKPLNFVCVSPSLFSRLLPFSQGRHGGSFRKRVRSVSTLLYRICPLPLFAWTIVRAAGVRSK